MPWALGEVPGLVATCHLTQPFLMLFCFLWLLNPKEHREGLVKVSGVPPRGTVETKYFFFLLLQGIILGFVLHNWFSDLNISQFGSAPKSLFR